MYAGISQRIILTIWSKIYIYKTVKTCWSLYLSINYLCIWLSTILSINLYRHFLKVNDGTGNFNNEALQFNNWADRSYKTHLGEPCHVICSLILTFVTSSNTYLGSQMPFASENLLLRKSLSAMPAWSIHAAKSWSDGLKWTLNIHYYKYRSLC